MAKAYMIKGPGAGKSKVVVSDQDAHWLNAYVYRVYGNGSGGRTVARFTGVTASPVKVTLTSDIYGAGIKLLHINGNALDLRRSNCTVVTRSDMARLMILDEKIGCSFSQRRNFKKPVDA